MRHADGTMPVMVNILRNQPANLKSKTIRPYDDISMISCNFPLSYSAERLTHQIKDDKLESILYKAAQKINTP